MKKTITKHLGTSVHGKYAWMVLDSSGQKQNSEQYSNHIFSGGLNMLNNNVWADLFRYCFAGNQNNPDPSTGSYEAENSNRLEEYSEEAGPSEYFTGIVGHPYNITGCKTVELSGNGEISGLKMRRTFDFPENPVGETSEAPDKIYTEIGWGPTTSETNLFSRIITHTGDPNTHVPIAVKEGQFLRVIYELDVTFDTGIQDFGSNTITGYTGDSAGSARIQKLGLSAVSGDGSTIFYDDTSGSNEPSVSVWGFLSDDDTALSSLGSCVDRSTAPSGYHENRCHHFTYVPDSYEKVKRFFVSGQFAEYTGWKSMGIGVAQDNPSTQSGITAEKNNFVYLFDQPFNKEKNYLLNVLFKYTWSGVS